MDLPDFLKRGEPARLIPVLADTNREQRIASILLSLLPQIPSLAEEMLSTVGLRVGKRTKIEAFTEVVLKQADSAKNRPDGLLIVSTGKTRWSALVEAKIGTSRLESDQVTRYVEMARANGIDAVITISNEFVTRADHSPVAVSKTLLRKVGLFHWSWTWIATQCEILAYKGSVEDAEQAFLLDEIRRFFDHPGTGVQRFTHMGKNWKDLNQSITNNATLKKSAPEVEEGVACWIEEERDLCLQLSRHVGEPVDTIVERKLQGDPAGRLKSGIEGLVNDRCLVSTFRIPDSAADIVVRADMALRTVSASMKLKAPQDRKSTKARVNWLLKMLKDDDPRILVWAHWPGRGAATDATLAELREEPDALQSDNKNAAPHTFEVRLVERVGKRFAGSRTFIEDVERIVPEFYDLVGQHLRAWQAPPPKPIKTRSHGDEFDDKADVAEVLGQMDQGEVTGP
ncbi:hypothetical protein [Roseovarius sp.]|uniref:hypothetical protein n=1 Tax=Roseovarius sp. TaxID=1486281 RepID=UPI003BACF97C